MGADCRYGAVLGPPAVLSDTDPVGNFALGQTELTSRNHSISFSLKQFFCISFHDPDGFEITGQLSCGTSLTLSLLEHSWDLDLASLAGLFPQERLCSHCIL